MPKWVRESSAVSGPACPATHSTLPTLSSEVLRELAEQAHRPVLEIRERAVSRARAPEAVEVVERVGGHVDRGQADDQPGVAELRDLRRQHRAVEV